MAAAVSNAGGLGIITALTVAQPPRGAEALRDEIRKCRKLTFYPSFDYKGPDFNTFAGFAIQKDQAVQGNVHHSA